MTQSLPQRCEPASTLIAALGGLTSVAKAAHVTVVTVQRWRFPVEKGGTGGFIPRKYHQVLIDLAQKRGVELSAAAFVDVAFAPSVSNAVDRPAPSTEAA